MDEFDNYLASRLKHWAAEVHPAPGNRQRILRMANLPRMDISWQIPSYWGKLFSTRVIDPFSGDTYHLPPSPNAFLVLQCSVVSHIAR